MGVGCIGVGASGKGGGCSLVGEVIVGASCARWSVWAAPLGALRPALVVEAFAVFWLRLCLAALAEPLISLVYVGVSISSRWRVEVVASSWRALVHGVSL